MFRGIKNIASDIRSDVVDHDHVHIHGHGSGHSQSHSQSSRTRRFLASRNESSSTLSDSAKNKRKGKVHDYEEIDGKVETDTIVSRALLKYFREQGSGIPNYMSGISKEKSRTPESISSLNLEKSPVVSRSNGSSTPSPLPESSNNNRPTNAHMKTVTQKPIQTNTSTFDRNSSIRTSSSSRFQKSRFSNGTNNTTNTSTNTSTTSNANSNVVDVKHDTEGRHTRFGNDTLRNGNSSRFAKR